MLRTVSATRGSVTHEVHCEACGGDFEYTLTRIGFATGRLGLISASNRAQRDLDSALQSASAAVRCPDCGHFQTAMITRRRRYWLKFYLVLGALTTVAYFCMDPLASNYPFMSTARSVMETLKPCFLACAIVSGVLAIVIPLLYNPNSNPLFRTLAWKRGTLLRPGKKMVSPPQLIQRPRATPAPQSNTTPETPLDFSMDAYSSVSTAKTTPKSEAMCPGCQKRYKIPDAARGKTFKCKACGGAIQT